RQAAAVKLDCLAGDLRHEFIDDAIDGNELIDLCLVIATGRIEEHRERVLRRVLKTLPVEVTAGESKYDEQRQHAEDRRHDLFSARRPNMLAVPAKSDGLSCRVCAVQEFRHHFSQYHQRKRVVGTVSTACVSGWSAQSVPPA